MRWHALPQVTAAMWGEMTAEPLNAMVEGELGAAVLKEAVVSQSRQLLWRCQELRQLDGKLEAAKKELDLLQ